MRKLLLTVVTGTLLTTVLAGCDLEILPMPAGVVRTYDCVDCYDTVVEEAYIEPAVVVVDEPVYVEETYTEEYWGDEPVVDESYVEDPNSDAVYVEGDYVAGY